MLIVQYRQLALQTDSWKNLPPRTRALLQREGLDSPSTWRAAGTRRTRIFGIPVPMIRELDRLARDAS